MPSLREQDFDKLAERVVSRFLSGQAKLADAAAEEASTAGLNPDQIERLTQSANTMAFLKMMDQRKQQGAGDLMHEFDPIDSRHVIKIVIDNAGVHVEPMGGDEQPHHDEQHELPDEMSGIRMNPAEGEMGHEDSPEVEDCEEQCHEKLDPPGVKTKKRKPIVEARDGEDEHDEEAAGIEESPKQAMHRVMRMRKLAGVMEDQYHQACWAFEEGFAKLASRFKIATNAASFDDFEKDARAEYNDAYGDAVLDALRVARGQAPVGAGAREKTAAQADYHVSDDTQELREFETLVKIAAEADKLKRDVQWLKTQCA